MHDLADSSYGERDVEVLTLIGEEDLTLFTFDGLKRRMGLHPETLSRILGRLEQEGIVDRDSAGYKVTAKIDKFVKLHSRCSDESRVPLLQTFLPSFTSVPQLVSQLKGKWFGLLRWLGLSENGEDITLKWITENGSIQVEANISETTLSIEAKFLQDKDMNMALKASYQLMAYIGRLCSRSGPIKSVNYTRHYGSNLNLQFLSA